MSFALNYLHAVAIEGIELTPMLVARSLLSMAPRGAFGNTASPYCGYAFLTDRPTAIIRRSWSFAMR